jgi:hypothetical protein
VLALRPGLWSHGGVRLAPGVKLRRVGFHEGPVDRIREVPIGIRGSSLRLEENLEVIL